MTEPILISISQNVLITPVTGITDEVNRCYQPSVDEKYEEGGEYSIYTNLSIYEHIFKCKGGKNKRVCVVRHHFFNQLKHPHHTLSYYYRPSTVSY